MAETAGAPSASLSPRTPQGVQRNQTYLVAMATTGTGLRETRRGLAFSNLASEVTQVTSATVCPSEVTEAPPGAWKGDTDFTFCGDPCQ